MSIYQSYHKSLCLKVTYTRRYKISGAKCEAFIVICKSEEVVKKKKNSTGTQWVTPCTRVSRFFPMWKCEQLVPLTVTHKREPASFFFPQTSNLKAFIIMIHTDSLSFGSTLPILISYIPLQKDHTKVTVVLMEEVFSHKLWLTQNPTFYSTDNTNNFYLTTRFDTDFIP